MKRIFLVIILFAGFLLRTVAIDKIPVGFTPDEASFGYDAYSILKTGRDQWGETLPVVLESFGDYKSPLYTYLTIPFVWLFGLNKFAVRLPNAIVGSLAIYVLYLLTKQLTSGIINDKRLIVKKKSIINNQSLAILSSFLLAISPWHIMMSRGAFEANLTTLLLPLSLLFFLKGLKISKYLIYSVLFASLNMFTYHSAKFITPLLYIFCISLFWKEIKKIDRNRLIAIIVGFLFSSLFVISLYSGSATRMKNVSISGRALLEASDERTKAINSGMNPLLARLIYNKYQAGIRHFTVNYLSYFSPQFYFTQGPAEGTYGMIPGRGVLYWIEGIFIIGFFIFFIKNYTNKLLWIIIFWYLISPVTAALSIGPGHAANRAEGMIPSIQIISALGAVYIYNLLKSVKFKKYYILICGFLYTLFMSYFVLEYYFLSPLKSARPMLWASLKSAEYVVDKYFDKNVLVSRSLSEPHIYFAFAQKYEPASYQKSVLNWKYKEMDLDWVDQMPEYTLGNYTFSDINPAKLKSEKYDVFVGKPEEFDDNILPSNIIYYPDKSEAVYIVETK